jgi:putative hydrolase of the HAD superfamily
MRAALFDLDGTLFDRDGAVRELVEAQVATFVELRGAVNRPDFVARVLELDDHGYRDKTDVYQVVVRELGLPDAGAHELTADFWRRYQSLARPFPDVLNVLDELRRRGLKTGVITNGRQSIQDGKIDALGIRGLLDTVSISEVEGVRKPDRRIFDLTLGRLGVAPGDGLFVGDHPEVDVAGARGAGLYAIWKRTPHWGPPAQPVPTIDTLSEVLRYA